MNTMSDETIHFHGCEATATKQSCPNCQTSFACDLAQGKDHCWCMKLPAIMPVCSTSSCLCEQCLQAAINERQASQTQNS
jgi:hypothetical protein